MKKIAFLDISQFRTDATGGFYANTLENHLITSHKDIFLPHSHNFYLAVLFTQGIGIHEVDFTSYAVKPGALFFLNPGQTHHWELSTDTKGYIFFHTQEFYDLYYTQHNIHQFPFFYSLHNRPCLYLNDNHTKEITPYFRLLLDENASSGIMKKQKLMAYINLVYIESTRLYLSADAVVPSSQNNAYYQKFTAMEALIEKHFRTEKSPAGYAAMLNVSLKHLSRITGSVAGKTPGEMILERVLLEAKKELVLQRHNFNEIAYSLGYEDYAYFSRLFKKKTGETPTAFLKKYTGN